MNMLSHFQDPSNRDRTVHQGSDENCSARKIAGGCSTCLPMFENPKRVD